MLCQKRLHESCRVGRRIDADSPICSLSHCECHHHTVHKLSQWRLAADWLVPREGDCPRMHSNVSSDWLPSYIKATWPVLEIFEMAGYFPDSTRTHHLSLWIFGESLSFMNMQDVSVWRKRICFLAMTRICVIMSIPNLIWPISYPTDAQSFFAGSTSAKPHTDLHWV